jgi:hypothetical protein
VRIADREPPRAQGRDLCGEEQNEKRPIKEFKSHIVSVEKYGYPTEEVVGNTKVLHQLAVVAEEELLVRVPELFRA